jgi:hypothetical protein
MQSAGVTTASSSFAAQGERTSDVETRQYDAVAAGVYSLVFEW